MKREGFHSEVLVFFRNNQQIVAGFVALIALVIAISMMFDRDRAGVIDYGEYTRTLYEMGLSYTDEVQKEDNSIRFVKVIEKFKVDQIQILRLLQLKPSQSLIYPVSFLSFWCKFLKVPFSTRYLSILFTFITILCIYSITKSSYCYLKEKAASVGVFCSLVFLCGNYTIYFNSLYRNGIYFISYLAFITVLLYIGASKRKGQKRVVLLLLFVSLLLLNAKETTIIYLPIVIAANIWAMVYCRPKKEKRISYYFIFSLLLFWVVRCNITFTLQSETLFSNTQLYHSFFTGILQESKEKEALLKELKLDASLVEDIGKNAYLSNKSYIISPNEELAEKDIFSKLSYGKLLMLYGEHPKSYMNVLEKTAKHLKQIDSRRFLSINRRADEGTEWVERFVWWQWIRAVFVPDSFGGYFFITCIFLILLSIIFKKARKKRELYPLAFLGLFIGSSEILQYLTIYAWQGFAEESILNYYFILTFDTLFIYMVCIVIGFVTRLQEKQKELELSSEELYITNPIFQVVSVSFKRGKLFLQHNIFSNPNRAAFWFMLLSAMITCTVLFYPTRIGAYNNGDFGRMMSAMNIQYTQEDWENSDELSLTKVVERYDWVENYDYTKLLPYNADLSQIWFSVPLKILNEICGLPFSTVYVTIMYVILIVISMFYIMQVLFERFGVRAGWFAIVLLFVLLDYVNLGWLNSLFGEGIAYVSLLMVIASALKVANAKRGSPRFSLFALFFSMLLFIGAKAQLTITVPVFIIGAFVLLYYHQPSKFKNRVLYYVGFVFASIWISVSAYHIYQNNSVISSPDTIYQSIFFGLLMLVDDPKETLIELGLDPIMAADVGKHAYLDKSEYVCPPRTKEAENMLYSKITTFDVFMYYLKHPKLLLKIMDITAEAASKDMPDYTITVGQKTTLEHEDLNRFGIWGTIRSYLVFDRFWQIAMVFLAEAIFSLRYIGNKKNDLKNKVILGTILMISAIGIIQFPLTFIGNGFADNTKQLYVFRIIYDLTVLIGVFLLFPSIKSIFDRLGLCYANQISLKTGLFRQNENEQNIGGFKYES